MARQRLNVGVLITEADADVAAFFNALMQADQKPAKWLSGMLAAYAQGIPFSVPDLRGAEFVDPKPEPTAGMMFGNGSVSGDTRKYGWQVRGPHGEIVKGSVVNVSFCRGEIIDVLLKMRSQEVRSATFLKELIRHDMECDGADMTEGSIDRLLREFYLRCGKDKGMDMHVQNGEAVL